MNIEFENDFLLVVGLIVGLIFVLKIIFGFISRLVELRATRKILGELYDFTNKACRNLILYANDGYNPMESKDKDNKDIF